MAEGFLGEIRLFALPDIARLPRGWLPCDGRQLEAGQYMALYSLLGLQFGGESQKNFNLPDLRGRVFVGEGQTDYDYQVGQSGGAETVTLTTAGLPPHTHQVVGDANLAETGAGKYNYFGQAVVSSSDPTPVNLYSTPANPVPLNSSVVSDAGSGQAHYNLQPYTVITFAICVLGLYPPRY